MVVAGAQPEKRTRCHRFGTQTREGCGWVGEMKSGGSVQHEGSAVEREIERERERAAAAVRWWWWWGGGRGDMQAEKHLAQPAVKMRRGATYRA